MMWRVIRLERTRLARRIGRRGLLLILAGLSWVCLGVDIIQHPESRFTTAHPTATPNAILSLMSDVHWGWLWVFCGAVAAAFGLLRQRSSFRKHDSVGFNAILTPPFLWLLFFLWSYVVSLSTHGAFGRRDSIYGLIVWLLVSLFVIVVAGWPDATEALVHGRPDDDDGR